MTVARYYRNDKNAPKTTQGAHLGANAIITCQNKLLLEKRSDCNIWGLIGGGVKKTETPEQGMIREIREELGIRISESQLEKLQVYGEPGRIAAYQDGSVWRMVLVIFRLDFDEEPALKISSESTELKFFSRDEISDIQIVKTHEDIIEDWFLK